MKIFMDTETGGLDPLNDALLSIGLVLVADREIVSSLELYINPDTYGTPKNISQQALTVNGLTMDFLRDKGMHAGDVRNILERWFSRWCGDHNYKNTFVGWNIQFDIAFLKSIYNPAAYMHRRSMDLTSVDMFLHPNRKSYHLQHVLLDEGIVCDTPHNALSDAIATYELWKKWT